MSGSKKKDKVDLSKLSAMETLLIGESQSLCSQPTPCSSKSLKNSEDSSGYGGEEVDEMTSSTDDSEDADDDSSDDESNDWEEVNDQHVEAELQKLVTGENGSGEGEEASQIPENGLEIVIPKEGVFRIKKNCDTVEDILRRAINKERLEVQENLHKVSVLCQIIRCLHVNKAINSECLHEIIAARLKGQKFTAKRLDIGNLEKLMKWFRFHGVINKPSLTERLEVLRRELNDEEFLAYQITESTALYNNYTVMIFVAFLRFLKIEARLVVSLQPLPLRPPAGDLIRKEKCVEDEEDPDEKVKKMKNKKTKKKDTGKTMEKKSKTPGKNSGRKMISSSSEDDYEDAKKQKKKKKGKVKQPDITSVGQDMWTEVFLKEDERWVSVDILTKKVVCDTQLEREATKPLTYVVAIDENDKIKDVTRRYASEWLTRTQKLRADPEWWGKTLKPYRKKQTSRDREEDDFLDQHLMSLPVPKSMSEIKGHPLFVLRRHLLKFEALYPENPASLGFIKGEPIYSREDVHTLHTRELWLRNAKVVRIGEKPYKIVKARPKYDKVTFARLPEAPSELFGSWQTEDYEPPVAVDGKVPRNEYGNVDLYTEKMVPRGCVHLRLAGLQRIAKKLDIDCAPAVVGFDFGWGGSRPAFDGFIVCEEFEETLVDAWQEDQEEKKKRDEEKRLQRIYGNWRKLTRGVLIRDRLEQKYSVNLSGKRKSEEDTKPVASTSKRSRRK